MKNNKEKIEKVQDDIRQEYGDDAYDKFLEEAGRMCSDFIEGNPLLIESIRTANNRHIPSIDPNDIIKIGVSVDRPYKTKSITKFKDIIYKRFGELKEKHGNYGAVNPAFFELKQELKSKGISPEDYGLRDEPQHFNKTYNDWLTECNKK